MSILPSSSSSADQAAAAAQAAAQAQAAAALNSAANANSSGGSALNPTQSSVSSQFNTFLTLLTTELQNQDPTSPLDTNQFTSQLVQFSQLEQTLNTNTDLQTLITGQQSGAISGSLGYLGHTVQTNTGNFTLDGTNTATLDYTLAGNAATATINIVNASGQTVRQISGDTSSGAHSDSFDGTEGGSTPLPPGQYSFTVSAVDSNGNAISSTVATSGVVTGVDSSNGTVNLHIGNLVVPASSVVQVTS
jgi:flagellar basal-body rod modification protein FlgD